MRLICFWCAILAAVVKGQAQGDAFYAPQTYRQSIDTLQQGYFTPSRDVTPQGSALESWRPGPAPLLPAPVKERWGGLGPISSPPAHIIPKVEPWKSPYPPTKEQRASILHHKQALTSEGAFRFEYASDNGLAAGEQIEPDGSRVGAYQYKDPSGQLVSLKYRAGKDGFQILEGSHLPKSPEPVPPPIQDNHYQQAYEQQQRAYQLQQQHNQEPLPQTQPQQQWREEQGEGQKALGGQYFVQNWRPQAGQEDDGQYRENGVEDKGPHSFGEGYAFSFKGQ